MNIIKKYLKYTEEHEAQEIYHKWSIISVIASILTGRCWTSLGYDELSPNFFLCLIGPVAARKTAAIRTAISVCKPLLDEGYLIKSSESPTTRALYDELVASELDCKYIGIDGQPEEKKYMNLLTISTELSNFIKQRDPELPTLLLELFDCKDDHKYATKHCGSAHLKNASLNLLSAATPAFLQNLAFQEHITSGLSSRFIFLFVESRRFNNPDPTYSVSLQKEIQEELKKLVDITGFIPYSKEGKQTFFDWYNTQPLGAVPGTPTNMLGYYGRRQTYVRKLGLILWALDAINNNEQKREITDTHVLSAIELIEEAEEFMLAAYNKTGGRALDGQSIQDIVGFFQSHINEWVNIQAIKHKFVVVDKSMSSETVDQVLQTLTFDAKALEIKTMSGRAIYKFVGLQKPLNEEGEEI